MQVLIQGKTIQVETEKDILLEILADKYSRAILETTMKRPKSVMDISNDCGISLSTSYRRVLSLHDSKILRITGSINNDGKKYFLYKSKIKSIVTYFNNGILEVEMVANSSNT